MADTLDGYRYIGYVATRWRWVAISCASAVLLAFLLTALETPQYTATARILIDPPSGTDARTATAVSPIYLESLRTYESFAAGDSLFLNAIDRFGLRKQFGASPIESIKKRVLKAGLVRNTRILEISVTLPDAPKAQAMAQFLAESTAGMNRDLATGNDRDVTKSIEAEQSAAQQRVAEADAQWAKILAAEPTDELTAALAADADLRAKLQEQLLAAQVDTAGAQQREKNAQPAELAQIRGEQTDSRARMEALQRQIDALNQKAAADEKLLGQRQADHDRVEAERKANQASLAAVQTRLMQARAEAGTRAERLRVIDPGIVPERPSSPNRPLNLAVALFLGAALPAIYLLIELSIGARAAAITRRRGVVEVTRSSNVGR